MVDGGSSWSKNKDKFSFRFETGTYNVVATAQDFAYFVGNSSSRNIGKYITAISKSYETSTAKPYDNNYFPNFIFTCILK